jgi:hypothetical protein
VHVDRSSLLAAALEEIARVVERPGDELVGVVKVDRLDAKRAGRGQDDQVGVGAVALDVVDQAAMGAGWLVTPRPSARGRPDVPTITSRLMPRS